MGRLIAFSPDTEASYPRALGAQILRNDCKDSVAIMLPHPGDEENSVLVHVLGKKTVVTKRENLTEIRETIVPPFTGVFPRPESDTSFFKITINPDQKSVRFTIRDP